MPIGTRDELTRKVNTARDDLAALLAAVTQHFQHVLEEQSRGLGAAPSSGGPAQSLSRGRGSSGAGSCASGASSTAPPAPAAATDNQESKKDLTTIISKSQALRKSVEEAIKESEKVRERRWAEETGTAEEEQALKNKIEALKEEVRLKNKQVKVLIDEYRDLHKDLVVLVASRKAAMPSLNEV